MECGGSGTYDSYYSEFGVWLTDHTRWVGHTFSYPYGVIRTILDMETIEEFIGSI